jgi:hypothetical protein
MVTLKLHTISKIESRETGENSTQKKALSNLTDDTSKYILKISISLFDKFSQNKTDKNARDLPASRSYLKEMTVDSDDNRERYDHC